MNRNMSEFNHKLVHNKLPAWCGIRKQGIKLNMK